MILVPATPRRNFLFSHVQDESDVAERLKLDQEPAWKLASRHSRSISIRSQTPRVRLLDSSHFLQASAHGRFGADLHYIPRILILHLDLYFILFIQSAGVALGPLSTPWSHFWEHHPTKPSSLRAACSVLCTKPHLHMTSLFREYWLRSKQLT